MEAEWENEGYDDDDDDLRRGSAPCAAAAPLLQESTRATREDDMQRFRAQQELIGGQLRQYFAAPRQKVAALESFLLPFEN